MKKPYIFNLEEDLKKRFQIVLINKGLKMSLVVSDLIQGYLEKNEEQGREEAKIREEKQKKREEEMRESSRVKTPAEREEERQGVKLIRDQVAARGEVWDPEPYGFTDDELDK